MTRISQKSTLPLPPSKNLTASQKAELERSADLDDSGKVDVYEQMAASKTLNGRLDGQALVDKMAKRKELFSEMLGSLETRTFAEADKAGLAPPYFFGFFNSNKHTLGTELVQHLRTSSNTELAEVARLLRNAPKDAEGRITFETWQSSLFREVALATNWQPREMQHGGLMGPLTP